VITDPDMAEKLWEATTKEVEAGLLKGPFLPEELERELGPLWVAARRFGIWQGTKLRPIDDFAEFLVNASPGSDEKIALLGVDQVVAWARAWLESADKDRNFSVLDNTGIRWSGALHSDWTENEWTDLKGRVADLKNAYKQSSWQFTLRITLSVSLQCKSLARGKFVSSGPWRLCLAKLGPSTVS